MHGSLFLLCVVLVGCVSTGVVGIKEAGPVKKEASLLENSFQSSSQASQTDEEPEHPSISSATVKSSNSRNLIGTGERAVRTSFNFPTQSRKSNQGPQNKVMNYTILSKKRPRINNYSNKAVLKSRAANTNKEAPNNRSASRQNTALNPIVTSNLNSATKLRAFSEQNDQENTSASKQFDYSKDKSILNSIQDSNQKAQSQNQGSLIKDSMQNVNDQAAVSHANVRVSKTSKTSMSRNRTQSSNRRKNASQNLRIIILHGGNAKKQQGTHVKNTSQASQRSKVSKSEETSKSTSTKAGFRSGSKSGSMAESSSMTAARHREMEAAQNALVTQTAGRTEILLTQQMAAQSRRTKTESYSRSESMSESQSANLAISGAKHLQDGRNFVNRGEAGAIMAAADSGFQNYSTSSSKSSKYEKEQQSSISSTVEKA